MTSPLPSLSELDVPVENLFLLDQLTSTEQALRLLNQHLRGTWPMPLVAAAMQSSGAPGAWGEPLGFEQGEVLRFASISMLEERTLFRARLTSYFGNSSASWIDHRLHEDFGEATRPGSAGLLLGVTLPDSPDDLEHLPVYGYLIGVRLHDHPANANLQLLEEENIILCGDVAVVGGWLSATDHETHPHHRPGREN